MANHELQSMHSKQAKLLTRILDTATRAMDMIDKASAEGNPELIAAASELVKATTAPAMLTVVNNFLKQNGIEAENDDTKSLNETEAFLASKKKRFDLSKVEPLSREEAQ